MRGIKPKIYIIPGMGESTRARNYSELIKYARNLGFRVMPVNIHWSTKMSMDDYVKQADLKIPNNIQNGYILGFSFGAYVASILSSKKNMKGYIFCSISPYFKENLKYIPKETKKYFGKKLFNSFRKYSFPDDQTAQAWFLIGKKDWKIAIKVAKESYKKWLGKKSFYLIKEAGHNLAHPNYLKRVKYIIKML